MQAYRLSPDYSDQEFEIRVWLKPFFGLLCLDLQEEEDCYAFGVIPKAPEMTK